jgi:alanyl-tRNA synthetase
VEQLLQRIEGLEDQVRTIAGQRMGSLAEELAGEAARVGETALVVADAGELGGNEIRQVALGIRDRLGPASLTVIGARDGDKGALVAVAGKALVEKGVSAGELLVGPARELAGGGSRDPELAQAGGPNGSGLHRALELARTEAERLLGEL